MLGNLESKKREGLATKNSNCFINYCVCRNYLDQWCKAQDRDNIPLIKPFINGDGRELWTKFISGVKVNVHAALYKREGKFGYGCVVRDTFDLLVVA